MVCMSTNQVVPFSLFVRCCSGRATLEEWALIFYGTSKFPNRDEEHFPGSDLTGPPYQHHTVGHTVVHTLSPDLVVSPKSSLASSAGRKTSLMSPPSGVNLPPSPRKNKKQSKGKPTSRPSSSSSSPVPPRNTTLHKSGQKNYLRILTTTREPKAEPKADTTTSVPRSSKTFKAQVKNPLRNVSKTSTTPGPRMAATLPPKLQAPSVFQHYPKVHLYPLVPFYEDGAGMMEQIPPRPTAPPLPLGPGPAPARNPQRTEKSGSRQRHQGEGKKLYDHHRMLNVVRLDSGISF